MVRKKKTSNSDLDYLAEHSPHHQEFPPHAVSEDGIPYALEVIERHDDSVIVKQGSKIEDVSPVAVKTIQHTMLDKLRRRLIDDLEGMGYKDFELWICRHILV